MLPEGLLHVLSSQGAGAWASAMISDSDTPELVWTHAMRAHRLIPQVCPLLPAPFNNDNPHSKLLWITFSYENSLWLSVATDVRLLTHVG